jgi:molybdate transport system substrate-binding protein
VKSKLLFAFYAIFAALALHAAAKTPLTISVATSLRDVMGEIKTLYLHDHADIAITLNITGSGAIQRQIENGEHVDVFISASPQEVFALQKKDLLAENSIRNVAKNTLVLIVPKENATTHSFSDLTKPEVRQIAVGQPRIVAAGTYTTATFRFLKLTDALAQKLVPLPDVRQIVSHVGNGLADAGVVYTTDAMKSDKVRIAATAGAETHQLILYPSAIPKTALHQTAAREFSAFLVTPEAQALFRKHGFLPPS